MLQSKVILYPKSAEISYKVALLKYVYFIEKNINNILIPVVRNMPDTFNKDNLYEIRYDDFSDDIEEALEQIRVLVKPYRDLLIASLPARFRKLASFTTKQVAKSLSDVVSVEVSEDLTTNIFINNLRPNLQELVKSATLTNARLITSIEDKFLDDVAILIQDSYRSGLTANAITKQIKDKFGVTENRAILIARDQIGKLHSDIVRDEHLNLGITKYKWLTSNDERVRASHKVLNDKICSWYDPTIYKDSINDKKWKKRSSIGGVEKHPGQDYQCRCDEIAIFE